MAGVSAGSMAANPVPRATVPPSSYSSGLINAPNPIDRSGSLPITGNVLGGKHFRGSIPYNSTTSFGAPLGSTSLDSFLRYSGVPEGLNGYPRSYSPFYSPSGTVTTTQPGYRGVFPPTSPRIAGGITQFRSGQPDDIMALTEVSQPQIPTGQYDVTTDSISRVSPRLRYWPMTSSPADTRDISPDQPGEALTGQSLSQPGNPVTAPAEYQRQLEQLRRDIERIQSNASRLEQNLSIDSKTVPPQIHGPSADLQNAASIPSLPSTQSLPGQSPQPGLGQEGLRLPDYVPAPGEIQTQNPAAFPGELPIPPAGQPRLQLYDPSAGRTIAPARPPAETGRIGAIFSPQAQPGGQADRDLTDRLPAVTRVEETARAFDATSRFLGPPPGNTPGDQAAASTRIDAVLNRVQGASGGDRAVRDLTEADQGGTAQPAPSQVQSENSAPQRVQNTASVTQAQFNHYVALAESHMLRGRYQRAAESFALASVYIPHDPQPHLGKSHALFAAGEYLSSATSLIRAIELDARYALRRLNLVEIVGGPDPFVQRIGRLEDHARDNSTPQLQVLLAYIYYQMDRPVEARAAIAAARKGLPSSPALDRLEAALRAGAIS